MGFMRLWGLSKSARKQREQERSSKAVGTTQTDLNKKAPPQAFKIKLFNSFRRQKKVTQTQPPSANSRDTLTDQGASSQETRTFTTQPSSANINDTSKSNTPEVEITPTKLTVDQSPCVGKLRRVRSAHAFRLSMDGEEDDCHHTQFKTSTPSRRRSSAQKTTSPDSANLDLALTKFQLRSARLSNSSSLLTRSPTPAFHDSGVDLAEAAELQTWKRAYHVQQVAHNAALMDLNDRHEADVGILKNENLKQLRTMSSMMRTATESNRAVAEARVAELKKAHEEEMTSLKNQYESMITDKEQQLDNVVSRYQGLHADFQELQREKSSRELIAEMEKAYKAEMTGKDKQLANVISEYQALRVRFEELSTGSLDVQSSANHTDRSQSLSNHREAILKSRLEQSDLELAQAQWSNNALQNAQILNNVQERQLAELQFAWQQEVNRNQDHAEIEKRVWIAETRAGHLKTLWEKERIKNMDLRLEQENVPGTRYADMEQTIEYLKKQLADSELENNKHVAAFDKCEKDTAKLKYVHAAELAALCGQVKLYKSMAKSSNAHKRNLEHQTATLINDLHHSLNSHDVGKAVNRFCDTISHNKEVDALLEETGKLLDETYKTITALEIKNSALETKIIEGKSERDKLDLELIQHKDKIDELEFTAHNHAEDYREELTKLQAEIQEFQSQMNDIEAHLRSGLDSFTRVLLESKDQALDRAYQRIKNLECNLDARGFFYGLDGCRDRYIHELEEYPARLYAAQAEIKHLQERIQQLER